MKEAAGLCFVSALLAFALVAPARAQYQAPPDVVVLCEPTLLHALTDIGAIFRQETGVPVRLFTSPTPALLEQVRHGARSDILIGEGDPAASAAIEGHLVKAETLQHLWRNRLVIAAATAKSSPTPVLAALAGKAPIAIVDPWAAVAGAEGKKALEALGVWDAVSSKSIGVVDTADAAYLLAHGKVQWALVYATDVAAHPSLTLAEQLPPASYQPIDYWGVETARALSPNADRFLTFLRGAEAQARIRNDGLEPLP